MNGLQGKKSIQSQRHFLVIRTCSNLVKEGYEVYGMDHQGHGLSEGDRCFVEDFDHFVDDVSAFVSKVMKDKNDNLPQFLFGHSMGGTISLHVAHSHPECNFFFLNFPLIYMLISAKLVFKGVILSGPFFLPAQDIGTVQKWLMGTFSSYLPKAPIPQRIPPAHVSRSSETGKNLQFFLNQFAQKTCFNDENQFTNMRRTR